MLEKMADVFRCPETGGRLHLESAEICDGEVKTGQLVSDSGQIYLIQNYIPDLTFPARLDAQDIATREIYDTRADVYDEYLPLTFSTFALDETKVRNDMIDLLRLNPGMRALDVGAGTGRDSILIADRLGSSGELHCQDLSVEMLRHNRERFVERTVPVSFSVGNALYLPYADKYFDAIFQFGGINHFNDVRRFFREVKRVAKVGARVVVGAKNMPIWLKDTAFARVLSLTNPWMDVPVPLADLPVEARDVHLRWIIGNMFYVLSFTMGEGEPPADFDFPIPGARGGTHRTRYFGQLEGVTPRTKQLAQKAREKLGISMHDWLDDLVRREALSVLKIPDE